MTGHDLDLAREIREVAETWLYDGDTDRPLPGFDRLYDLADEVESRCAKLAAAEQALTETSDGSWEYEKRYNEAAIRGDRAEAALAAVREAARPLMKWVEFHTANYSGNPPNRRLAISYEAAPVTFADVQAFVAALAAAEQDEPGCLGDCGWKHCRPPCPQASQPKPTTEQP